MARLGLQLLNAIFEKVELNIENMIKKSRKLKIKLDNEDGSISPLILGLFLVAMILSVGIINVSDSYIAKRELINISEEISQKAAHSLDYTRYYLDDQNWVPQNRIPLDCGQVREIVFGRILTSRLRNEKIEIDLLSCDGDQVRLKVHSNIRPVMNFPIFRKITGESILIEADITTATVLG